MTGYGESVQERDGVRVRVELRAINNRYLRVGVRCEGFLAYENRAEELIRLQVRRGTVSGTVRVVRTDRSARYQINPHVVQAYLHQIENLPNRWSKSDPVPVSMLLQLPGVVEELEPENTNTNTDNDDAVACVVDDAVRECLTRLAAMREAEGQAMHTSLQTNLQEISERWQSIQARAPEVAEGYRQRLHERINQLLAEHGVSLSASDLVREVAVYSERCDVSEELVRLQSHIQQFRATLGQSESNGRKLDFLIQEMVRETNTLGAKANDPELAIHVVEIKAVIDRMREMVQNVE